MFFSQQSSIVNDVNDSWYITGGRIIDPGTARDEVADLLVQDGVIQLLPLRIDPRIPRIDARGLIVAPGFIDLHVHLREPGDTDAETIDSGTRAAAHGGFTAVVAMPNTRPATDRPEHIRHIVEVSALQDRVHVHPAGCITRHRAGLELADLAGMAAAGAVAFTDDGATVANETLLRQAMVAARCCGKPIFDHALDPVLAGHGVMHAGEWSDHWNIPGISSTAEIKIVARDIRLCEETGCALHIQHVSARESVALIRAARARELPVTAEATPHHLALTDADVHPNDTNAKMNPPVRSEEDRIAICSAVADGTITALATDHAPHTIESKSRLFRDAPFGVIGLETAIGVTYTALVHSGRMSLLEWVRRWTEGPTLILGLPPPALTPGQPANIVLLELNQEWTVQANRLFSKSRNTPFLGQRFRGNPLCTLHHGKVSWDSGITKPCSDC